MKTSTKTNSLIKTFDLALRAILLQDLKNLKQIQQYKTA
jgi:hypothetical protein